MIIDLHLYDYQFALYLYTYSLISYRTSLYFSKLFEFLYWLTLNRNLLSALQLWQGIYRRAIFKVDGNNFKYEMIFQYYQKRTLLFKYTNQLPALNVMGDI